MMLIEELTATITRLRRGDLEAWIRDELVAPTRAASRSPSRRWNAPASGCSAR